MIEGLPPKVALGLATPGVAKLANEGMRTFAGTLTSSTNAIEAVEEQRDDSTDAAERSGQPRRDDAPTELRAQRRGDPPRAQRHPGKLAPGPDGQATDAKSTTKGAEPQAGTRTVADQVKQLATQALTARPDLQVAALARAIQSALAQRGDTSAAARDAATKLGAITPAALRHATGTGMQLTAGATPQNQPGRFAALMQQLQGTGTEGTSFRLVDGTAGTLEVKVALSGQDLLVQIRAVDPAMAAHVAASLDEVQRQLRLADLVPAGGTITVTQEESSHGFDPDWTEQPESHDGASAEQ